MHKWSWFWPDEGQLWPKNIVPRHLFRDTHGEDVLHGDDEDVVGDQEVPVVEDLLDGLEQQVAPEQQEVEAGHQVAHAEDRDARGASDEDDGEHEPEQVAEHDHLEHVQVGPARGPWHIIHWLDINLVTSAFNYLSPEFQMYTRLKCENIDIKK